MIRWLYLFLIVIPTAGQTISAMPDNADSIVAALYTEGNYWKAIDFSKTVGVDTMSARFCYLVGMSYASLGEQQRAQELLLRAITVDSTLLQYRYHYGRILAQSGQYAEAAAQFMRCISMDSTYIPARFQLGLTYAAQRTDPEKEIEIFSSLIRENPKDFLSYYYISDAFKRSGYEDSSAIFLQFSLNANPRYYPALIAFSNYLSRKNRYLDALPHYVRADSIRNNTKDLLFQIGECYRKLNRLNEAKKYFAKAIALDSMNGLYHAQLAYTYFMEEQYDSSVAEYRNALRYDEENAQYYLNLALVYKKLDRVPMVVQAYTDAVRVMHPETVAYAYYDLAAFYFQKQLWRDAVQVFQRVIDIKPDHADAFYFIGMAYERLSQHQNAILSLNRFIARSEEDTTKNDMRVSAQHVLDRLKRNGKK